jgi:hypothetical protein
LAIFIAYPWLAAPFAAGCFALWRWRRRAIAAISALGWLLYCGYETLMKARVLCSGECNIRVDLLLIYPALAAFTVASLVTALKTRPR